MTVKIGHARYDENGRATGGVAGDQTKREVSISNWYAHSKGWVLLRPKDKAKADKIAKACEDGCANDKIGYDQYQNQTLFKEAQKVGFNLSKITTACETDCARFVRVCCFAAGIKPADFYTGTQAAALMATGEFEKLTESKYTKSSNHLRRGDILVTKTKGHTVMVLSDGSAAKSPTTTYKLGDRQLSHDMRGDDVKELQNALIKLGYALPKYGADAHYGTETQAAVKAFQKTKGLSTDGIYGKASHAALSAALSDTAITPAPTGQTVTITGDTMYYREGPSTTYQQQGVVKKGERYELVGASIDGGWWAAVKDGKVIWVSGRFAKKG